MSDYPTPSGMPAIAALAAVNLALGFACQWLIVTGLGPGQSTDAFYASTALFQFVFALVAGPLVLVLQPLLANSHQDVFGHNAWNFLYAAALVFAALACVLYFASGVLTRCLVPGFDADQLALAQALLVRQLPALVAGGCAAVLQAACYAKLKFVRFECTGMVANVVVLCYLLWGLPSFGPYAAAWSVTVRTLLHAGLLIGVLGHIRRPILHSGLYGLALRRLGPLLTGCAIYKTDPLIDRALASMTPAGNLTLYHMAQQIIDTGLTLLRRTIVSRATTEMAVLIGRSRGDLYQTCYRRTVMLVSVLAIICLLALLMLGRPAIDLLYGWNRFGADHGDMLWYLLLLSGGTWVGGAIGAVTSAAFYAKGDTVTPTRIGIVLFILYLPVKVMMFYFHGVAGLAVSTSLFYMVNLLFQYFWLGHYRPFVP